MRTLIRYIPVLALAACVQISDKTPDSAVAKIDTSSGLLATASGRVDSNPAGIPRTPPLVGAESVVTIVRGTGSSEMTAALQSDTAVGLVAPDSALARPVAPLPATATDLDVLRHEMQVPVSGIAPAMLHDT